MGPLLGPVLAGVFMIHVKQTLYLDTKFMTQWTRYVDNTIATTKPDKIEDTLDKLNSLHPSIQFSYELEREDTISSLDIKLERIDDSLSTTVYQIPTNTKVSTQLSAYTPKIWKMSTLKL